MYTQNTIQQLKRILEVVEANHQEQFRLFAPAQRHYASTWELLICASWLDDDMMPGLRELSQLLNAIDRKQFRSFGSMIALDKHSPVYTDIVEEAKLHPPGSTIYHRDFGGIDYDQLDILRAPGHEGTASSPERLRLQKA